MEEVREALVPAPVPDASEFTVSSRVWDTLTQEVNAVVARIDAGEELVPEDVVEVRSLVKQVESYLTMFNRAMRDAQATYKQLVAKQLESLGYGRIENYIREQREKQSREQNERIAEKQARLQEIVASALAATNVVKDTVLSENLLPAFSHRFPNINSAAKAKDVKKWEPYVAVVTSTLQMLDAFFTDPKYGEARELPITSSTMQRLLCYVKDGEMAHLVGMKDAYAQDEKMRNALRLQRRITSKAEGFCEIRNVLDSEMTENEKMDAIACVIDIMRRL